MTTLVLSNHIPAIESALIAAGKPVIVCLTEAHAALRGADDRYPLLTVSSWDAYDEIAALAHSLRGRISTVATRWEGALIAAGFIRDLIGLSGQSMAQAVGFVDKAIMKDTVRYAGVPVARHRVVPSISDLPKTAELVGGWPIVVKPLKGFASTNTHVLRNPQELASATAEGLFNKTIKASAFYDGDPAFQGLADQPGGFLVEEFVDIAAEYHCDGLWVNGEPLYQFPGQYHTPPLRGMGGMLGSVLLDPQSPDGRRVVDLSIRAAKALGMATGFTHAEVYRTAEGRWLLGEIAARPGGGGIQPAIKHAYGVDVLALQGKIACGEPVDVNIRPRKGVVGWAGPAVPPGRIISLNSVEEVLKDDHVIGATMTAKIGQMGGRTGSGLWGGLAGYVYLRGSSPAEVFSLMRPATERYGVKVDLAR